MTDASPATDVPKASHEPTAVADAPAARQSPPDVHGTASASSVSGRFSLPVSWNNLHYSVGGKEILRGLTGTALASRALAIMGSSGAGKTTLLNALCDRLLTNNTHVLKGHRQLGEVEYERHYRKLIGFVTQDDVISSLSTPESSLKFSLRIRRGTNADVTAARVEEVLQELHLTQCRDTVVGVPGLIAGLSGGERKRCNIGMEIICDPKILFLDEPTSGLDSVTSAKIIHLLSELARRGRTVIYTIHQPTAEVLSFFDDLLLLAQGRAVYHGPMAGVIEYFAGIGYICPETFTPTDYFMTLLQDEEIAPKLIDAWIAHTAAHPSEHTSAMPLVEDKDKATNPSYIYLNKYVDKTGSSLVVQAQELFHRSVSEVSRNVMYIFMTFVQAVFFGIVVGLIFVNLGHDVQSVQDRQGLLFMVCANRGFGSAMMMINTFPREKAVFIREQQAGAYSPFLYFLMKSLAEFPIQVLGSFVECVVVYFFTQLHQSADAFFYYFAVLTLLSQVAGCLGFMLSASIESFVVAAGAAPLCIVPAMMCGGLLASTDRLRPYWIWLEKLSFIRHAYVLVTKNEFERMDTIECNTDRYGAAFCASQPQNGTQVIANLGFDNEQDSVWAMWVSLAALYVIFRICVVLALMRVARTKM